MVKQVKSRRMPAAATPATEFNSRHLLLAGLGAVSLTRKEGVRLYGSLVHEGRSLQGRANDMVASFSGRIDRGIVRAQSRIRTAIAPLRTRATATLASARANVEARLQPVLVRFGIRSKVVAAKPKTRRTPATRVVRKPRSKAA